MDISNKAKRKRELLRTLDVAKSLKSGERENLLIDIILDLQDSLQELQEAYCELSVYLNRSSLCVHLPF